MFIAGAFVGAFLGVFAIALVRGAADLHPVEAAPVDDDETLVGAFFRDLAVEQEAHAAERERADVAAEIVRDLLYGGPMTAEGAALWLRAHDGAHR